ncbi:MAG: aconitase family protein [Candidatus Marinimicrobia bacterium]|nr:aconitase family protein [Candidatus Neomarinimicrobiota bacterium]
MASDADGGGIHPRINDASLKQLRENKLCADGNAHYAKVIELDTTHITPVVSGPHGVKNVSRRGDRMKKQIPVHKAYLLSCVNGRYEDFIAAADVLREKDRKRS